MDLLTRIEERSALIGVVGLGYVGLPLVNAFSRAGFRVVGLDTDADKVARLERGQSYIKHIPDAQIQAAREAGFEPTTRFERSKDCDAVLICVPTPLTPQREPDMQYVVGSCEALAQHARPGQLFVLESTTYPGTTDEVMRPIFERTGLVAGQDFLLAFSPEREDPNNPNFTTRSIPKVVGADSPEALEAARALYSAIVDRVVVVSSSRAAEATKILENTFRAVNIALVNELKMVFERMGIDIWEVVDAAATKPFGFMRFTPGPGLGGHCIPIDPFYLTWKARELDMATRFIETAGEINSRMPHYVVERTMEAFSARGLGLSGTRILIVGLAYKPNVDDARMSPSYKLMELLEARGVRVDYHDPYVPVVPPSREHSQYTGRRSVDLAMAGEYDAVLIATDHSGIDWAALRERAPLLIDTRGVYRGTDPRVIKA
jgi:UDP-N-acetyl-D-glucosamine dehydrogenase